MDDVERFNDSEFPTTLTDTDSITWRASTLAPSPHSAPRCPTRVIDWFQSFDPRSGPLNPWGAGVPRSQKLHRMSLGMQTSLCHGRIGRQKVQYEAFSCVSRELPRPLPTFIPDASIPASAARGPCTSITWRARLCNSAVRLSSLFAPAAWLQVSRHPFSILI